MSAHGLRQLLIAASLAGCFGGCHVPPAPDHAQQAAPPTGTTHSPNYDPYDGWLYKSATGQGTPAAQPEASGVRQASATEPVAGGPASSGAAGPAAAGSGAYVFNANTPIPSSPAASSKEKNPEPKDDDGWDWSALYPSTIYKNIKASLGYGPSEPIARQAFQDGQELFRQKRYAEAAAKYAVAADRWPGTPLEEDALFMLGESQFFSDQYSKAEDTYEQLLKSYKFSRYLDRVVARQFAIGQYWEKLDRADPHWAITPNWTDKARPTFDTWGWALKAYEHVRMNDPTGPLADAALMASANAYFVAGRYEEASYNYDLLRKEYAKSQYYLKASLLTMEAKQHVYQGPMYDGRPLKQAIEVADQVLTRFGGTLGPERQRVIEAKNRFVEQMAEREWAYGQYYDRNHFYGAARYYYRSLLQQYPQTRVALVARQRIDEIKGLPDEPPKHFQWLNDVFDTKRS